MLKNWTVTTKQIKKSSKGIENYANYLHKQSDPAHAGTTIVPLKDSGRAFKAILSNVDDRTTHRRENGLRGGGVRNYATSFVLSLPNDVKQPSAEEWKKIASDAVRAIARTNDLDAKEVWKSTIAVMHFEETKNNHLHLAVANVHNNEVIKGISQLKTTFAVKQAFNKSMLSLGVDHAKYAPYSNGVNKPLWKAREDKLKAASDKLKTESNEVEREKQLLTKLKKKLGRFTVSLGDHLEKILSKCSADALQRSASGVVDRVEEIGQTSLKWAEKAQEEALKLEREYDKSEILEEVNKRKDQAAKQPDRKRRRRKRNL